MKAWVKDILIGFAAAMVGCFVFLAAWTLYQDHGKIQEIEHWRGEVQGDHDRVNQIWQFLSTPRQQTTQAPPAVQAPIQPEKTEGK